MKKLYILALLFLMPLVGITNAMERDIPEGKEVEQGDTLGLFSPLPLEIIYQMVLQRVATSQSMEAAYYNVMTYLISLGKLGESILNDDAFIKEFIRALYGKFIPPVDQLSDGQKEIYFDKALTLAASLKNNDLAVKKLKEWLKPLGNAQTQKEFLNDQMIKKATYGSLRKTAVLLQSGADINAVANDGSTMLMMAVVGGSIPIINYLIQSGADITAVNDCGQTARYMAGSSILKEEIVAILDEAAQKQS